MSAALMPATQPMPSLHWPNRAWSRHALAVSLAVGLHAAAVVLLVSHWQPSPPPEAKIQALTTQLITLAPPQAPAPEPLVAAPVPAPAEVVSAPPAPVLPKPVEAKPVQSKPQLKPKPVIDHAALARKRVQEEQQAAERAQQQAQQQQAQQRQVEQQRQQQVAAAAQAEAKARAAADALAAESRPYLPVSKEAPEYPDKALEKGIEGDCTVTYTVTPQGRVENPQVLGQCHPLLVRPSLAAARTFRYQPRIVDGQAISVANVKNTFHYRIE
ncbi:MAG: TonB family protein [Pseudomonas sp.]|uniref:energy transducer TonB n=1 Tax=Pseudomonas sp. TaxID=306 RepID=UPI0030F2475D